MLLFSVYSYAQMCADGLCIIINNLLNFTQCLRIHSKHQQHISVDSYAQISCQKFFFLRSYVTYSDENLRILMALRLMHYHIFFNV